MSSRIVYRAFEPKDLAGLVELWNRTMSADPVSQQRLLLDFLLDPHFDREGLQIATDDASLIGFVLGLAAKETIPSDNPVGTGVIVGIGVDAGYRRQGIGTQLLVQLESVWRKRGVNRIQVGPWIPPYLTPGIDESAYPGAVPFFAAHDYDTGGKPVSMRALLTGYVPAEGVEDITGALEANGVRIRPAVIADAIPLLEFAEQHFSHWVGYVRGNLRELVSANDASTLHMAVSGDEVIGFALTNGERFGPFGVNESWRGRGVGAVLLSRALCAMRAANIHAAYFLWTSDQTARLYGRHGFEIVRRFTMVSRQLGVSSDE